MLVIMHRELFIGVKTPISGNTLNNAIKVA